MNTPITIYPTKGKKIILQVPEGEALFWAEQVARWINVSMVTVVPETADLPYLGYIACPENRLAAEWLIDQHVQVTR